MSSGYCRSSLVNRKDSRGRQKLMDLTKYRRKVWGVEIVLNAHIYYILCILFFCKKKKKPNMQLVKENISGAYVILVYMMHISNHHHLF